MRVLLFILTIVLFSSCSLFNPSFRTTNTAVSLTNETSSHIEALKRDEYEVIKTTTGKATSSTFYFLFFPIGKHKSNEDLYENAYYDAVENLPNSDGLILPREKTSRFIIPLIIFNYSQRTTKVSGLGISVNGKVETTGG